MHAGSGPRYTDWSHLRVPDGEREAAAPYIPAARKLLGFVMDEARRTGLKSHKIKRTLKDGTVIIAEKIGDQPRMTIIPKGGKEPIEIRTVEGFVFPRRSDTSQYQSAILEAPSKSEDSDWKALFYSSEEPGFDLAPSDRRGTYVDVFGIKAKQPWQRLELAGGMWLDRETEEAVTWFRAYLGYWPMHYRHPATNYSSLVAIYGHLTFTAPDPAWRVLAAAKRGMWLYVMVGEDLGALDPPVRPATASESGQVWCSQPYTDDTYTYSLRRYPLSIVTQPDTLIDTYRVMPDQEGELLWQGELTCAYGAWSFNADCTSVVTIQLPRIATWYVHVVVDTGINEWVASTASHDDYPAVGVKRFELTISHGVGTPSVTFTEEAAPITIAEEDGRKLNLVHAAHTAHPSSEAVTVYTRMEYQCDGFAVAAIESTSPMGGPYEQLSRTLVHAHLPTKTFLFLRRYLGGDYPETVNIRYELYVNGEEVEITDDPYAVDTTAAEGHPVLRDEAHARLDVPWIGVSSSIGNWLFKQDIDSMTFLLGTTFSRRAGGPASGGGSGPFSQAYFIPTQPFVPTETRLNSSSLPATLGGAIPEGAGAGGWSVAKHGGPAPFDWDDGNEFAAAVYFNKGQYLDLDPSDLPFFCPFGGVSQFGGKVVIAVKLDVWAASSEFEGNNAYPFHSGFYPLRYATDGDARELIDAIDGNRLATLGLLYYAAYPVGHTGKPMKRQQTRFDA